LLGEVQLGRLESYVDECEREEVIEGKVVDAAESSGLHLFYLKRISEELSFGGIQFDDESMDAWNLVELITTHVESSGFSKSIKSAAFFAKKKMLVSEQDLAKNKSGFQSLNRAFCMDYFLRKKMLLSRLEVTIQSLMWAERAQLRAGEMRAALQEILQDLYYLGLADLDGSLAPIESVERRMLVSTYELCSLSEVAMMSRKHTLRPSGSSAIRKIIIDAVPDRGGRLGEVRKDKSMPRLVTKKQSQQVHQKKRGKNERSPPTVVDQDSEDAVGNVVARTKKKGKKKGKHDEDDDVDMDEPKPLARKWQPKKPASETKSDLPIIDADADIDVSFAMDDSTPSSTAKSKKKTKGNKFKPKE
jgi:hypothetical protein